ncbi:hypothetical protein [Empedobacter falsenii]
MSTEKSTIKADVAIRWTILIVLSIFCLVKIIGERDESFQRIYYLSTAPKIDQQEDSSLYKMFYYWKDPIYKYDSTIIKVNYNKTDAAYYAELIQKFQKNKDEKAGIKFKLNNKNTFSDITNMFQILENVNQRIFIFSFEDDYLYILKPDFASEKIRMIEGQL